MRLARTLGEAFTLSPTATDPTGHPITFEGQPLGWLTGTASSERAAFLARLLAPVLACPQRDWAERCLTALARLRASHPHIDWIGVYRVEAGELVLTAQLPLPADHLRLSLSEGICGQAVREGRTLYVPDAATSPDFVPCEFPTLSSLVIPIRSCGRVVAEIEVDALVKAAYPSHVIQAIESAADELGANYPA